MKKLLFVGLAAGLMSTSLMAGASASGTIEQIKVYPDKVAIAVKDSDGTLYSRWINGNMSSDTQKAMIAAALTAKSAGKKVFISTFGADGCNGTDWCILKLVE